MKKPIKYTLLTMIPAMLLVIFAVFFLSGSYFLTTVVLPLVSRRLGVEIAAERVDWSPWSSTLAMEKFRVGPAASPGFAADSVSGRYFLGALWRKEFKFSGVVFDGARLVLYRSGSNWSMSPEKKPVRKKPETGGGGVLQFDLTDVTFRNSQFRMMYGDREAGSAFELTGLALHADRFANGSPLQLRGEGELRLSSSRASHIDSGKMRLSADAVLNRQLIPETLSLDFALSGLFGSVSGEPLNDGALALVLDSSYRDRKLEIRKLSLRQWQSGESASELELSGAMTEKPFSVRADVDLRRLSPEVTAVLFDLGFGFNPGRATLSYRGKFSYGEGKLAAAGELHATRSGDAVFDWERISLPAFRLDGEHDFVIDLPQSAVDLKKFSLSLTERENEIASLQLRRPVQYSWRNESEKPDQRAVFDLECNSFDLKLLHFLVPRDVAFQFESGYFSSRMQLALKHNFSSLVVLGSGRVNRGSCRWDGRRFELAEIIAGIDAELYRDFNWTMRNFSLALRSDAFDLGSANFSGEGNLVRRTGKISGRFERLTPELAAWLMPVLEPYLPEWRRLELGTAEMEFTAEKPDAADAMALRRFRAVIDRSGSAALELKSDPIRFEPGNGGTGEFKFQLTGSLPMEAFNPYLKEKGAFSGGRARLNVTGSVARNFRSLVFDGELSLDDLALLYLGKGYDNFSAQCAFSCYLPEYRVLEFKTLNFYLRRAGKPALRLECPGNWDFQTGGYTGDWAVRYLNEQFVRLFDPGLVSEAQLSGKFQMIGKEHFREWRAAGALDLTKWQIPKPEVAPLAGKLTFVADRKAESFALRRVSAELRQSGEALFELSGEGKVDFTRPDGPVAIQLRSGAFESHKLLELFTPPADSGPPRPAGEIPRLDFGPRPVDISCLARKIHFTPNLELDIDTRIRLNSGKFATDYLRCRLNGSAYDGEVRGENVERGIAFRAAARGSEPLKLAPFLEMILGNSEDGVGGTLNDLAFQLDWLEDGRPESFVETLDGELRMLFRNLQVPNTAVRGKFGQLLLFPVDMVAYLGNFLPRDIAGWKDRIVESSSLSRKLRLISFSQGTVKLRSSNGKVEVEECSFLGDWVSKLLFSGNFNLFGAQQLDLVSQVTVGGLPTVIPVRGTLSNPAVELDSIASNSLSSLLDKLKELNVAHIFSDADDSGPVLMIEKLPSAGTIRELQKLFKEIWK